jgi:serine/threonine protein kinase
MECPTCRSRLEPNARFCGVCGYRMPLGGGGGFGGGDFGGDDDVDATQFDPHAAEEYEADFDPFIGVVLNNRFTIEAKLGEGGFGAVYRGVQSGTNRKVAIKVLHPDMSRDENLVQRFRREGLVLCNLRDAHTVTTYDFDQTPDGMLYIAMELLEGRSLHDVFKDDAPIDWKRMFKIVSQMCSSLAEAHAQGIVHRDLKPENVYLENRPGHPEFVKILDFGIAKLVRGDGMNSQSPQLTATGQTLGTLEYMSPEQLMGKQLDGRSDMYALGVLTYELVTGRLPFPDAKGPAGLITAQLRQTPEPLSKAVPQGRIPPAVDQLVLKMLGKDKESRYSDVNELREELNRIMYQADAPPSTPVPVQPGPPPQSSGPPPMASGPGPGLPGFPAGARQPAYTPPPIMTGPQGPGPGMQSGPVMGQPQPGGMPGQPPFMQGPPGMNMQGPPGMNMQGPPGMNMQGPPGMNMQGPPGMNMQGPYGQPGMGQPMGPGYPQQNYAALAAASKESSSLWIWIVLAIIVIGGGVGAFFALT